MVQNCCHTDLDCQAVLCILMAICRKADVLKPVNVLIVVFLFFPVAASDSRVRMMFRLVFSVSFLCKVNLHFVAVLLSLNKVKSYQFFFFSTHQLHAARSGHSNFSESTEEIKPLTEEEKKQQLEKYGLETSTC